MFKGVKCLKDKPKFSIIVLLFFALIFTATGVYLIYRSMAAETLDLLDGTVSLPSDDAVMRVWGNDRYATAVGVSQKIFVTGPSGCVVITNGESWPDAAVASPLAGACNGSILLAQSNSISTETTNEIKRLKPAKIYMVGGTAVLSSTLESSLRGLVAGTSVKRISGATRYDTSVAVANEIALVKGGSIPDKTIFVVTGTNYPDALTVGSVAALKGYPVLYADSSLSTAVANFISSNGITKTIIIGGTNAVSTTTASKLPGVVRITGADRYQTSYNFAIYALKNIQGITATNIGVAYGGNYPDALTAGPFLAKAQKSILILDDYTTKGYVTKLIGSYKASIDKIYILGGPAAISNASYMTYANNLGSDYTYAQVKTQAMVDVYVKYCPILAGSTVDYVYSGYYAVSAYRIGHIRVAPFYATSPASEIDPAHPLSRIIYHEIYHNYDWKDGDTNPRVAIDGYAEMDWGEEIPPHLPSLIPCVDNAYKSIGYVLKY